MIQKLSNQFILFIIVCLCISCSGIIKTNKQGLETIKTTEYRNNLNLNAPNDNYKVLINNDISAITAIKGEDNFLYKDMTYFDVYTRPVMINFNDNEFDNYFVTIPESWVRLYVNDSGVYLNYIPISGE
jgi:hypothetical protein